MKALDICHRLRYLREVHHINQSELAKHLGISQSTYAKVERGQTKITLSRFLNIAQYLQVDPHLFFMPSLDLKKELQKNYQVASPTTLLKELHRPYKLQVVGRSKRGLVPTSKLYESTKSA
jgi:transcriptional regulator with XRE-family HTH domain